MRRRERFLKAFFSLQFWPELSCIISVLPYTVEDCDYHADIFEFAVVILFHTAGFQLFLLLNLTVELSWTASI